MSESPVSAKLFDLPYNFGEEAAAGTISLDDLGDRLSGLLNFSRNFFLQFFSAYGITISGATRSEGHRIAGAIAKWRSDGMDDATVALAARFLDLCRLYAEHGNISLPDDEGEATGVIEYVGETLGYITDWVRHESSGDFKNAVVRADRKFRDGMTALGV